MEVEPVEPQSLKKLSFKSLKRALDLFSPIHGQLAPPDAESKEKNTRQLQDYGVTSYDIGTGFGHFAIATPDVYKMVEDIRAKGGNITREPGPVQGGTSVIAFVKDPDGYAFELIQRASTPKPLCQVMLRVGDLERSIKFFEKALGLKLVKKVDRPEYKVHAEYGGIKSTTSQPPRQANSAAQNHSQQARPSNMLALPRIYQLLL